MSPFVLDCSIALSWCFEDEISPETDKLLERARDFGAFVPHIWTMEVANAFASAERRGRLLVSDTVGHLKLLQRLPITVASQSLPGVFGAVLDLARAQDLTAYDAAYLDLALDERMPLATRGKALIRAAAALGIPTLPE